MGLLLFMPIIMNIRVCFKRHSISQSWTLLIVLLKWRSLWCKIYTFIVVILIEVTILIRTMLRLSIMLMLILLLNELLLYDIMNVSLLLHLIANRGLSSIIWTNIRESLVLLICLLLCILSQWICVLIISYN
jgi:hypothetical protein